MRRATAQRKALSEDSKSYTSETSDALRKTTIGPEIHWDADRAGQHASEECSHPPTGVFGPQQHSIAFLNAASIEFPCESRGCSKKLLVRPANCSISAAPNNGNFRPKDGVSLEVFRGARCEALCH